jgi:hypothetical protein
VVLAVWKLNQSLLWAFVRPDRELTMAETIYNRRILAGAEDRGHRGRTGLSMLLRGLKRYTSNLTAIVTVADDGGARTAAAGVRRHRAR